MKTQCHLQISPSTLKMNSTASFYSETEVAVLINGCQSDIRQSVHLIFVVDVSDSMMDGRKLASVKQSLQFIMPLLAPSDLVSLVTFGENSEILLNKIQAIDKDIVLHAISSLQTNGCTNLSAGLMNIRDCLENSPASFKNGVLLLTDGHANRGISDSRGLKNLVSSILADYPSLTLTTVGYGHDHNINLLKEISATGNGSYNIVYNLENVATTFGEVLGGLTSVVAQNVSIQFPAGTTFKTGYPVEGTCVKIGDVYSENEIIVLATVPTNPQICVKGHDMRTFALINESLVPYPFMPSALGPGIPRNVEKALFRYRVSELLKKATNSRSAAAEVRQEAEVLLAELKALSYTEEQLIQLLIDDMETLLIEERTTVAVTSAMAQHSQYLATGRGLRTSRAVEETQDQQSDDDNPRTPAPISRQRTAQVDTTSSPFMNVAQRRVTTSLRQTSSQASQ